MGLDQNVLICDIFGGRLTLWKKDHQIIPVPNPGNGGVKLTMGEDGLGQVDTHPIERQSLAAVKG